MDQLRSLSAAAGLTVALALAASACGSGGSSRAAGSSTTPTGAAAGASSTVWLCRPDQSPDPCRSDRSTTSVAVNGAVSTQAAPPASARSGEVDCFYVYPTVIAGPGDNAALTVQPAMTAAAHAQVSPFSTDCRVWAPVYRQRTQKSLDKGLGGDSAADLTAYRSLLSAWEDYLAHDNGSRRVVFIGHSQGATMLIRLLRSQVDPNPTVRARLVSALLVGGNVQVPSGIGTEGSFAHIPPCRSQAGGASWLQVSVAAGSADPAPRVSESLGPNWGYHEYDVNLALGNLVADVAAEEAALPG